MVIDEGEEQASVIEEKPPEPVPIAAHLTTITSLVEKEISKTLIETEKRSATMNNNNNNIHMHKSPERLMNTAAPLKQQQQQPPPPLITVTKPHSPAAHYPYSSHPQQPMTSKGSIMRGTPISSATLTNKPIAVDVQPSHTHSHPYNNPRNEFSHLPSPKVLDRNIEQQQHLLQQQHAAHMRSYNHPQQYLPQQQQQQQQQHHHPQHKSSGAKIEPPSTDTFETLRADYVTSKYLTTTHSPSHER